MDIQGRAFQIMETASAKALGWDQEQCIWGLNGQQCVGVEWAKQSRGALPDISSVRSQLPQGLLGRSKEFGFYPKGGKANDGFLAQKQHDVIYSLKDSTGHSVKGGLWRGKGGNGKCSKAAMVIWAGDDGEPDRVAAGDAGGRTFGGRTSGTTRCSQRTRGWGPGRGRKGKRSDSDSWLLASTLGGGRCHSLSNKGTEK